MSGSEEAGNGAPGLARLRALRERLPLPAAGRGPRWVRQTMWLRWLVPPAILAGVLSAGGWGWAGGVPGGRGARRGARDRQHRGLDDDGTGRALRRDQGSRADGADRDRGLPALAAVAGVHRRDHDHRLAHGGGRGGVFLGGGAHPAGDVRAVGQHDGDGGAHGGDRDAVGADRRAAGGLGFAERPARQGAAADPRRDADDAELRLPGAGDRVLQPGQRARGGSRR